MRKILFKAYNLSLIIVILIIGGCDLSSNAFPTQTTDINNTDERVTSVIESSTTTDASGQTINSDNTAISDTMPDDFAIDFEFWIDPAQKNRLDTYSGNIQKDLVLKGTSSSAFSCKKEDLEAIYARMMELSIVELSGNMISDSVQVTPNEFFTIRYRINGKDFLLSGDSTTGMSDQNGAENLLTFMEYLRDFMKGTPEYETMPDTEGGYD